MGKHSYVESSNMSVNLLNLMPLCCQIKDFYNYLDGQAKHYQTNNIILTMGGDFTYQQSEMYFMNLDKLIRYG